MDLAFLKPPTFAIYIGKYVSGIQRESWLVGCHRYMPYPIWWFKVSAINKEGELVLS